MSRVVLTIAEFHERLKEQGVERREDVAFKCVMCGTVQSIASFLAVGVPEEVAERQIGFSCVGRHTGAESAWKVKEPGRGCDWTLGGLFSAHKLTVIDEDGKEHPRFELASPEEAQALAGSWKLEEGEHGRH